MKVSKIIRNAKKCGNMKAVAELMRKERENEKDKVQKTK